MTAQEEVAEIVRLAKGWQWTPELFDRCRKLTAHVDVFNTLRRNLLPEEYEQFDLMYCNHIRPQDEKINRWLIQERREKEWRDRETELLKKKRRLLMQRSQQLTSN